MDRRDPDRIVVGLGKNVLGLSVQPADLPVHPGHEIPQAAGGPAREACLLALAEQPGLLNHQPEAPRHITGAARAEVAQLHQAPLAHGLPDGFTRAQPAATSVHPAQPFHRLADRMGRRQPRRQGTQVVPTTAVGDLERTKVVVAAAEGRRPQGVDQRCLVGRIGQSPDDGHQVPDLSRGPDERAGLDPVGNLGVAEGLLQLRQRGAGGQQHADVLETGRSPAAVAVVHGPAPVDGGQDGIGHLGPLDLPHLAGRDRLGGMLLGPEHDHRGSLGRIGPDRRQRLVVGLDVEAVPTLRHHEPVEQFVDPTQHGPHRPEVPRERHPLVGSGLLDLHEQGHIGPAEPVDRLLGVAHEKQVAAPSLRSGPHGAVRRPRGGDQFGDVHLDRVGVLELVKEQSPVAGCQRGPHAGAVLGIA